MADGASFDPRYSTGAEFRPYDEWHAAVSRKRDERDATTFLLWKSIRDGFVFSVEPAD
jgi:hypothetical protein